MKFQRVLVITLTFASVLWLNSCTEGTGNVGRQDVPLYAPFIAREDSAVVTRGTVQCLEIIPGLTRTHSDAIRLQSGSGELAALYVWPGDLVVEGQVVARLNSSRLETQISTLNESMRQSIEMHRVLLEELNLRMQLLQLTCDGGQASTEMIQWLYLDIDHMIRRHNLNMSQAQATLDYLSENLRGKEVRATFEGVVVHVAEIGQWINSNDPVMYVTRPGKVFVEYVGGALPVHRLRNAVRIYGVFGGELIYELISIENTVEQQVYYSRRGIDLPVRFNIITTSSSMPPAGELVFVHLYSAWVENALRVPGNSLFFSGSNVYVYRIDGEDRYRVYVSIGTVTDTYVEIVDGLREGDEVFVRP